MACPRVRSRQGRGAQGAAWGGRRGTPVAWSPGARNHKLCGGRGSGRSDSPPPPVREEAAAPPGSSGGEPRRRGRRVAGPKLPVTPGCVAKVWPAAALAGPGGGAAREGGEGGGRGGERRSAGWRMEPRAAAAGSPEPAAAASSFQARLWKNLQLGVGKSKGGGAARAGALSTALRTPRRPAAPRGPAGDAPAGLVAGAAGGAASRNGSKCWTASSPSSQPNLCCSSPEPPGARRHRPGRSRGPRCAAGSGGHLLPVGKGPGAAAAAGATPPGGRSPDSAPFVLRLILAVLPCPSRPRGGDRARDEGARRRAPGALRWSAGPRRAPPAWSSCPSRRRCRLALSQPGPGGAADPGEGPRSAAAVG